MVDQEGWGWRNERPSAVLKSQQKWGWISSHPTNWAELLLDTRTNEAQGSGDAAAGQAQQPPARVDPRLKNNVLVLAHLASYSGMGRARVECVANCVCESSTLDGHWEQKVSLMAMHSVLVSCSCRRARAIDFGMCVCCA